MRVHYGEVADRDMELREVPSVRGVVKSAACGAVTRYYGMPTLWVTAEWEDVTCKRCARLRGDGGTR